MARVLLALALAVQAASMPMTVLADAAMSNVDTPRQVIARTDAEWDALWRAHAGDAPRPAVDLSSQMVAAVFLGTRTTGGVSVAVVGTRQDGDGLVVEWTERRPAPGQVAPQIITAPAILVALPRVEGAVRFEKVSGGR
ncbi:MAG: protease complex subunit PrcB family protein [Vicinamibacterales bacterium]